MHASDDGAQRQRARHRRWETGERSDERRAMFDVVVGVVREHRHHGCVIFGRPSTSADATRRRAAAPPPPAPSAPPYPKACRTSTTGRRPPPCADDEGAGAGVRLRVRERLFRPSNARRRISPAERAKWRMRACGRRRPAAGGARRGFRRPTMSSTPSPTAIWQTATAATTERKPEERRGARGPGRVPARRIEPCVRDCAGLRRKILRFQLRRVAPRAAHSSGRRAPPCACRCARGALTTLRRGLASSVELPASHSRTSCSAGTTAASSGALRRRP